MQARLSVLRERRVTYHAVDRINTVSHGARCVTPGRYWIFLAFSKASSIVPTM